MIRTLRHSHLFEEVHGFRNFSLQFVSNLFYDYKKIPQVADNLALLGNIGDPESESFKSFIENCSSKFENIILVPGRLEKEKHITEFRNFHCTNKSVIEINGHKLIGYLSRKNNCYLQVTPYPLSIMMLDRITITTFDNMKYDKGFVNDKFNYEKRIQYNGTGCGYSMID